MKRLVIVCAACGIGKSTVKDELTKKKLLENYVCIDTDEVGINWWDYANTEYASKYNDDCLQRATDMAGDKNLLFVSCLHPIDFYSKVNIPQQITSTYFIALTCSDEEIRKRLKARPAERMCGSDEFIEAQIEYNAWIKESAGKFQYFIDNTDIPVEETAVQIAKFVNLLGERL